jgi:SAM-dependent methyltransferase
MTIFLTREVSCEFRSHSDWMAWLGRNHWATERSLIDKSVAEITRTGFLDPLFGYIRPSDISVLNHNYRESIIARNMNSRLRAVNMVLIEEIFLKGPAIEVYSPEAISNFARIVRNFCRFTCSEYLQSENDKIIYPDIRNENIMSLSFSDESFDACIYNDILEHITDIPLALHEAHRVLRPSGLFFGTFPMAYSSTQTLYKAEIVNGEIRHLQAPEYHENILDPEGGSLVFNLPGWDIIEHARLAGFLDPHIRFISSRRHAILGAELAGIFILIARRT